MKNSSPRAGPSFRRSTDSPTQLFNPAREYLTAAKVIRPGMLTPAKMVGAGAAAGATARAGGDALQAALARDTCTAILKEAV
ncbi:hypothetical protein [Sinosporangium album]|uniref:hypothetical protein n=1 Tax=Sinosporangium album TaxID=504805 RepID=UPI00115F9B32|nr:hypothetical protein [Sinosporangium album]